MTDPSGLRHGAEGYAKDYISHDKIKLYDDGDLWLFLNVDGLQSDDGLGFSIEGGPLRLSFSQVTALRDWLDEHIYDVRKARVDA